MGISQTNRDARRSGRGTSCVIEPVEGRVLMSGTVVDDYMMTPNRNAGAEDIVEDAAGNLYVAGGAIDAAGGHYAQVRQGARQADGSIAWSDAPVISYSLTPSTTLNGPHSYFYDLMIDQGSGDLYAAGQLGQPAGGTDWVVMKRSAADGAVTVLDQYRQPDGGSAWANGITKDAAGNLFVIGGASSHWVVRQLKPGAQSWETVQDIPPGTSLWSNGKDIIAAPSGVYAVGASDGVWVTQRAVPDATGAVTWATVDAYKADPNYSATAYGLGADAAGNVYVTGTATRATAVKKGQSVAVGEWTVRRTADAGGSWATIDRFAISSAGGSNYGADFGTDPAGNLYVSGYGRGPDGGNQAVVRWARPDGATWATLDVWQMQAGQSTTANGLLVDHTGTLYTVGNATEELVSARRYDWRNYASHAIVRRIDPPAGVTTVFSDTTISGTSTTEEQQATIGEQVLA